MAVPTARAVEDAAVNINAEAAKRQAHPGEKHVAS